MTAETAGTRPRFRPGGQADLAPSGTASRVEANLAALTALRGIQAEGRPATAEEQAILARWSAWGAVPGVFDEDRAEFAAARARLRELMTDAEYAAARRTTINAHYTDAALAQTVWDAVTAQGFSGGRVLEPGCGSGNFIGLAPPGAQVTGVELDPVTAGIAASLYPDAEIRPESFADTRLPDGYFDLVIGNVPFSSAKLHDRRHNPANYSMHNHFILKSLRLLKPGGLLAVVTSRYTMDAQDPAARFDMAELAGLVTAVRLPTGAHRRAAGTDAVTDLLIMRRHEPGEHSAQPTWTRSYEVSLDGGTAWINEYWRDHPEHVLGSFTVGQGQYNDHDLSVRPAGELSGVASQLAARLAARPVTVTAQPVPAGDGDRFEGTLRANDDGTFSVLRDGVWEQHPCPASQAPELRALLGLRDAVASLLVAETGSPGDTPEIAGLRAELNRRYDACAAAHGPVNRMSWKRTGKTGPDGKDILARQRPQQGKFARDPYAAAVYALEDYDPETGAVAKSAIFTKRVVTVRTPPETAETPADAVAVCMDTHGEVRLADAARLLRLAGEEEARAALGELVYDDPATGTLVPAAEYLSGKVRAKLRAAEQAAADDPRYEPNVAALRAALPPDLGPGDIDARLGASWIDPRYVQQGLREILEDWTIKVSKGYGTSWQVTGNKHSVLATQVWGTEEKDAITLAGALLEQRPVKVSPPRGDGEETRLDKQRKREAAAAATITARAKADELNRRFGDWLWEDPQRTADLLTAYNERFNCLVTRSYDGARPALPGLADWFRAWVHPHQLAAVARIVNEPAVLLAHDVGAGKTAEMTMGAMELRRLHLANKPAIVIPNHMLEQFQREFLQLYPHARVLAVGSDDLKAHGRHNFVGKIATGNWDAVIMTQSVFERIPMSAPHIERYIADQLAGYQAWLDSARAAKGDKRMIKKMETRMLMREQRLRRKLDSARDAGISFEQTGIDYLFIDEAHSHKNLDTRSNNGELDIDGSGRASDLEMKLDYLRSAHGKRVVTFATATPIANSMTEAYVMCRYLRPDLLADAGIEDFDAWVGTFAETTTDVEVAPEGGIRVKERFARFRNLPEMLEMWRIAADVKTKEDLKLPVPALAGGKPEVITVEPDPQLLDFMTVLAARAEQVRSRAVLPAEDNMLKISSDGRMAALDPRLIGLDAPEPGKLDVAAENIARIERVHRHDTYRDGDGNLLPATGSLQIVFCDLGTPGGSSRFNAYEYLRGKLAEHGVDPDMVAFMHDAKTDQAKADLFADARSGKVAVLVGSTQLMGVGTNVQDLAIALHHLDCPWRPADVAQREGRILRQRNKHPVVHIYRYVTERSFDAYMWQTVTRKAKFIDQVIHGKVNARDAEDIGGDVTALSYSEVTALATGDMRILAKARADSDVTRLERLESSWRRTQQHLKTKIRDNAQAVKAADHVITRLDAAIAARTDTRGEKFTIRLDGEQIGKRPDAALRLAGLLHTQISQWKRGTRRSDGEVIGALGGLTLISKPTWGSGDAALTHISFDGVPGDPVRIYERELAVSADRPPVGLIARLENKLESLDTARGKAQDEITRLHAETERAGTALAEPFTHAAALSRARADADRLADELAGQPSTGPGDTPDASTVPGPGTAPPGPGTDGSQPEPAGTPAPDHPADVPPQAAPSAAAVPMAGAPPAAPAAQPGTAPDAGRETAAPAAPSGDPAPQPHPDATAGPADRPEPAAQPAHPEPAPVPVPLAGRPAQEDTAAGQEYLAVALGGYASAAELTAARIVIGQAADAVTGAAQPARLQPLSRQAAEAVIGAQDARHTADALRHWQAAARPEPVNRCGTLGDENLGCWVLL
jgi:N12 class adenine-specific DNA methylase/SAM-dependent methyltransferase